MFTHVSAANLTYIDVLKLANASETEYGVDDLVILVEQVQSMKSRAFIKCKRDKRLEPFNSTIVVKLNNHGRVLNSWVSNTKPFTICFKSIVEQHFAFNPKLKKLYISFNYANNNT